MSDSNQISPRETTGGHDSLDDEERFGAPIDIHRLLRRLNAGKRWVVAAFLLGVVISLPLAKWGLSRTYKATAMLKFEGLPTIEGLTSPPEQNVGGMLQGMFIQPVLADIGAQMGYDMPAADVGLLIEATADEAQVVRIVGSERSPEDAARLANIAATQFLEHRREAERRRIQEGLDSLSERITSANTSMGAAQQRYDTFREEHGIADLTTEQESAIEAAAELRAQRDRTESDIAALEARVESLGRELRRTPRTQTQSASVGASPEAQELATLRSQLATARASLSDSHPRVQALQQQIRALQARIDSGEASSTRTATTGTNSQYTSLESSLSAAQADLEGQRQRLEGLTTQAATAQARVEQFSSIEGEASQLLAQVRVNQQLAADLQTQRAHLEDAINDPASGFRVMSEATPPPYAEASKKKYIVAAGIPLALVFLVLLGLLGRELKGLRVHTASEAAFWGRAPVIGTSMWPRDPQAIDDLIADMDDYVPEAHGQMLVVSANESELAQQFAARLNSDWYDTTLVGSPLFDDNDQPLRPSLPPGSAPSSTPPFTGTDTLVSMDSAIVAQSAAFARHQDAAIAPARAHNLDIQAPMQMQVEAWEGPAEGPALRRAARLADRVCVIVPAGQVAFTDLAKIRTRLGRDRGIGFILVNVAAPYASLLDRVGPVDNFWSATRE